MSDGCFYYPGIVSLHKNLVVINIVDIPNCIIVEYTNKAAFNSLENVVKRTLTEYLQVNKLPVPRSIDEINYNEIEIARLLCKTKVVNNKVISATIEYCTDYNASSYFNLITKIAKPIKEKLHSDIADQYDGSDKPNTDHDYNLSLKVYNRLLLRYSILRDIERLERRYSAHSDAFDKNIDDSSNGATLHTTSTSDVQPKESEAPDAPDAPDAPETSGIADQVSRINPALRAYRLATTDVFVEKAIAYLEHDSDDYKNKGTNSYLVAYKVTVAGVIFSFLSVFVSFLKDNSWLGMSPSPSPNTTIDFMYKILPKFTFYGMLIALTVGLCRYGKAMLDQSERLREKRHALRQGRLFVHLKDGELNIKELDKAFTWNAFMGNAFGNMQTETKSPIGSVLSDGKSVIENVTNTITGTKKGTVDKDTNKKASANEN